MGDVSIMIVITNNCGFRLLVVPSNIIELEIDMLLLDFLCSKICQTKSLKHLLKCNAFIKHRDEIKMSNNIRQVGN